MTPARAVGLRFALMVAGVAALIAAHFTLCEMLALAHDLTGRGHVCPGSDQGSEP